MPRSSWVDVETLVVDSDRCCGCGVCEPACPVPNCITIGLNRSGEYEPSVNRSTCINCGLCLRVCPDDYADYAKVEQGLGYCEDGCIPSRELGPIRNTYVGYAADPSRRWRSASGGVLTELLIFLLEHGLVDGVVAGRESRARQGHRPLFEMAIMTSREEIERAATSWYYPLEYSAVLRQIAEQPGRYAIVAMPCDVFALRKIQRFNRYFRQRIAFLFALFCGHNVSAMYTEFLLQSGDVESLIAAEGLRRVKYRGKEGTPRADEYALVVETDEGHVRQLSWRRGSEVGRTWGNKLFAWNKCLYCTDFAGDLADASFGDAWLPEYARDPRGHSLVVTRCGEIDEMLREMTGRGILRLEPIDPRRVIEAQRSQLDFKKKDVKTRIALAKVVNRRSPDYGMDWSWCELFRVWRVYGALVVLLRVKSSKWLYRRGMLRPAGVRYFVWLTDPISAVRALLRRALRVGRRILRPPGGRA